MKIRIPASPTLSPSVLLENKENLMSFLKEGGVKSYFFFGFARTAIQEGIKILGVRKGDSILLPSYICDVVVPPISELGVNIDFYRILPNLHPDIADITTKINRKTKAILVVDYFGFPYDESVRKIAEENDLYIIEDNAHSFLSKKNSRLLGTLGNIGVAGFRKILPVPDGAILFINDKALLNNKMLNYDMVSKPDLLFIGYRMLLHIITYYKLPVHFLTRLSLTFNAKTMNSIKSTYGGNNRKIGISKISLRIANNLNLQKIAAKRRENYKFWLEKMNERKGVRVIFEKIPEGIVPQTFPIVVEKPQWFMKKLTKAGVPVSNWPSLPPQVQANKKYLDANFLAKHLVTLPVHQDVILSRLQDLGI